MSTQPSSWPSADAESSARAPGHRAGAAEPLVSVIIPTYKRAEFLDRAIESALAQSYRPVEVIVVEDGSHDAEAVVSRYGDRVRYIWQENQGAAVTRNTGAAVAQGSWLAMLDGSASPRQVASSRPLIKAEIANANATENPTYPM